MPRKSIDSNIQKSEGTGDQKIQYGENKKSCFACGEEIAIDTEICPYCNTKQIEKDPTLK